MLLGTYFLDEFVSESFVEMLGRLLEVVLLVESLSAISASISLMMELAVLLEGMLLEGMTPELE